MRIYTTGYGTKVWRCKIKGASRPFCAHSTCYPDNVTVDDLLPNDVGERWVQREFLSKPAEVAPSELIRLQPGFVDSFSIVKPIEVIINPPSKSKPGRRIGFLEDE